MVDVHPRSGNTPPYDPLPEAAAWRIVDAALAILRETGVQFDADPELLDLFAGAGCDVSAAGLVKFDADCVRAALDSVAKSVTLWNRAGTESIEIRDGNTCFFPGMTAIRVIDWTTGETRASCREDLATIARVGDALPEIDGVCVPCKIVEHSNLQGEIEEFAVLAANTSKPLEYLCESDAALEAAIEMAAALRGGAERLAEKPYFLHGVTPLPLCYAKCHSDQILRAVRSGVPLAVGTVNIGGASTPISIAGNLAHALATDLAALVLGQLVRRGSFCIGCSDVGFMDPASGGLGGFSQSWLAEQAVGQICRLLGIPSLTGMAGRNRAARFDDTAIADLTASMLHTFHSRPATCDYLGLVEGGLTYSLHALLFCHDLIGMLRSLWRGIRVDDETLAVDVVRAVGPRGNYLAQPHTVAHCREELWQSRYLRRPPRAPGERVGVSERIAADLREILATHRPEPLDASSRARLRAILELRGAAPVV